MEQKDTKKHIWHLDSTVRFRIFRICPSPTDQKFGFGFFLDPNFYVTASLLHLLLQPFPTKGTMNIAAASRAV